MADFSVSLTSIQEIKQFVDAAAHCPCEVDVRSGKDVVNARSIMGLFSLDLSHPLQVAVQGTPEQQERFRSGVAPFVLQGT